ncbi:Magnesium transport protein CorA [compost metagenome]
MSFDQPINDIEQKASVIEDRIYKLRRRNILREGYITKRRASAFKKVLKFSTEALVKMQSRQVLPPEAFADLKDYTDKMIFYVDDVVENMAGLLNLHISLMSQKTNEASFRTNEVMRVLTLVSIFFLPLNFIAGVYGMNFENMPELHHENGYFWTLTFMALVALGIAIWIFRKGWLKSNDL